MRIFRCVALAAIALVVCSCGSNKSEESEALDLVTGNAVYHWKNWFDLDENETAFLKKHNIQRLYLRMFDVEEDYPYGAVPSSSIYMDKDAVIPENVEVVPTFFVTLEALKRMDGREGEYAMKIKNYIMSILDSKGIENVNEVQIDCDWTLSTQESFFRLCDLLRSRLQEDDMELSATIRLHQLSQEAPPVDRGVLMVYNVGNLKDYDETNSILRSDEVAKYLKNAPEYDLPLDVAYPIFSWGVVFRGRDFSRLNRISSPIDSVSTLRKMHDNWYEIVNSDDDVYVDNSYAHEELRYELPSVDEILKSKKLVEKYLKGKPHRTILYHLDSDQLANYTDSEIESIYEK